MGPRAGAEAFTTELVTVKARADARIRAVTPKGREALAVPGFLSREV
jgi:hypothetical protein